MTNADQSPVASTGTRQHAVRAWLRRLGALWRRPTTPVGRALWLTTGLFLGLGLAVTALSYPMVGAIGLLTVVGAGAIRAGLNPVTIVTAFVVAIFVVPARYALFGMSTSMLLGLAALGLWLLHRVVSGPGPTIRPNRMTWWIGGFLAVKLVSYANAQLHFRPEDRVAAADRQMIVVLAFVGVALYLTELAGDRRRMHTVVNLIVAGAAFMASTAIIEQVTGADVAAWLKPPGFSVDDATEDGGALFAPERLGLTRAFGSATGPLEFSTMLLACLPLAVHRSVYGRTTFESRLGALASFLIVLGLPMSVSRSAVVGLVLATGLILLGLGPRDRRRVVTGLGATALVLFVAFSAVGGAFVQLLSSFVSESDSTILTLEGRTDDYELVGSLARDRPVLGLGLAVHDVTEPRLIDGQRVRNLFLDNQYLSELVSGGLVGLVTLIALPAAAIGSARRARRHASEAADKNLAYSLATAVAIMMLTFAFFDALAFRSTTGLFFVLLGLIGALDTNTGSTRQAEVSPA